MRRVFPNPNVNIKTSKDMPDNRDQIKTKLTALAQLVAIYAKHEGITSTAQLAELTGYSERSIWKAKAELRDTEAECTLNPASVNPASVHPEAECSQTLNLGSVPRAHAYKESPTEIVISKLAASNARASEDEIEGLNGSTAMYVGWLAGWLSEWAPDREAAQTILRGNVELYGADKVRAGMLELRTLIASGQKPRNLAKAFPAYVKNACVTAAVKTHHANGRVTSSEWDRVMAEMQAEGAA